MHELVATIRSLGALIDDHGPEGERLRKMAPAVVEALRPTGAFRMFVPPEYGGPGLDPLTFMEVVDEVAYHDGSTGWAAMNSAAMSSTSLFLEPAAAREIYGDPLGAYAGAAYPSGRAEECEGGWNVSGTWSWGSGSDHADWMLGGAMASKDYWLMFFPAADARLHDNWFSSGLRGTASGDYSVDGAFVPRERAFRALNTRPQIDAPLASFPNFTLLATGVAASMLGMARRAVDELVALAGSKTAAFATRTLANYPPVQINVASAEARVLASRAFLRESVADAWETLLRGDRVSIAQRARIRLACANAGMEAAEATTLAYHAGGGTAAMDASPLQRCFRDVHTATQHIQVTDRNLITYGRIRLGIETDTSML